MDNIIGQLEELTGLTLKQLGRELSKRSGARDIDPVDLRNWRDGNTLLPGWLERVAAQWTIELWQNERLQSQADELWRIDTKYTKMLGFLTMADIAGMIKKHNASGHKPAQD